MKKYFLGVSTIVLSIAFSASTSKPKPTTVTDLVFAGDPTSQFSVEDETQYVEDSTHVSGYTCSYAEIDQAVCKLLAVNEKYTHANGNGKQVLNVGIAGVVSTNNPQGEQIVTVYGTIVLFGFFVVNYVCYSDAPCDYRSNKEDVCMQTEQ